MQLVISPVQTGKEKIPPTVKRSYTDIVTSASATIHAVMPTIGKKGRPRK